MMESEKRRFLHEIEQRRQRARQHLADGAVTDDYRADRATVLRLLDEALATELVSMLRYRHHFHLARGVHARPVAGEFLAYARDEEQHAERIAQRVVQLGGEPNYNPDGILSRSHSEYAQAGDLAEMIRENLVAERIAIDAHSSIARYLGSKDPTTRRLLEDILAKEEEHASNLADMLVDLESGRASDLSDDDDDEERRAGPSESGWSEPESGERGAAAQSGERGAAAQSGERGAAAQSGERRTAAARVLGHEGGPLPRDRDLGYGPSHGYVHGHGGPTSPGDAPATGEPGAQPE